MAIDKTRIGNSTLYRNVSCDQIQITTDKLRLKLTAYSKSNKNRDTGLTYLGIFLTSVATLSTATFNKTVWGFSGGDWRSVFQLFAFFSLLLLLYNFICFFKSRISINDFIEDCKQCE